MKAKGLIAKELSRFREGWMEGMEGMEELNTVC